MQYIQSITDMRNTNLAQAVFQDITTSNDQLQCVIFHIHFLKLKNYIPPFEVSEDNSNNTDHRILNQTYPMSSVRCKECLRFNGLSQNHFFNVISGHLWRVLHSAACALNPAWETPVNPGFCVNWTALRSNLQRMTSCPR